jgi:hypothetical protein
MWLLRQQHGDYLATWGIVEFNDDASVVASGALFKLVV